MPGVYIGERDVSFTPKTLRNKVAPVSSGQGGQDGGNPPNNGSWSGFSSYSPTLVVLKLVTLTEE